MIGMMNIYKEFFNDTELGWDRSIAMRPFVCFALALLTLHAVVTP